MDLGSPFSFQQQFLTEQSEFQHTALNFEDLSACDDCGLVSENMHDIQRHVKRWGPEIVQDEILQFSQLNVN